MTVHRAMDVICVCVRAYVVSACAGAYRCVYEVLSSDNDLTAGLPVYTPSLRMAKLTSSCQEDGGRKATYRHD